MNKNTDPPDSPQQIRRAQIGCALIVIAIILGLLVYINHVSGQITPQVQKTPQASPSPKPTWTKVFTLHPGTDDEINFYIGNLKQGKNISTFDGKQETKDSWVIHNFATSCTDKTISILGLEAMNGKKLKFKTALLIEVKPKTASFAAYEYVCGSPGD